ncbi:MAG: hypothetical protein HYR95_01580 [Candidatus Colwellbacteria bacterium]|nr:hypothetical protein [Candidatus Colwellbacteria bacterium]
MGRKKAPPPGWLGQIISSIGEFMSNLTLAANQYPVWSTGKAGDDKPGPNKILTPGERDILEAVENKISKLGFETLVRFVYLDKKDSFTPSNVSAVMGAMRQFSTQNLNSFRPNPGTITILARNLRGYLFRHSKLKKKKKKLFAAYRNRTMPLHPKPRVALKLKTSVLNTEELATIYHPPITSVGAPSLRHLESKKGGPPPNLPIE